MKKRLVDLGARPLLDVVSYGRRGVGSLSGPERDLILRTARRVPEVMVKVSGGGRNLTGVQRHLQYIDRKGTLDMETDSGVIREPGMERHLLLDWDIDLEERPRAWELARAGRKPVKLVHNVIFSMPPGTDPKKVLRAVRKLAVNQWALKHRYAMVLHTDEPHPHVHVVVKAMSEQGRRLNIRKATLRDWRQQFALNLRDLGVAANATERAVRGVTRTPLPNGMYRAALRGESTRLHQLDAGRDTMRQSATRSVASNNSDAATQREILKGWRAIHDSFLSGAEDELANTVHRFMRRLPLVQQERENSQQVAPERSTRHLSERTR